ncbi:short-chain dehydrogenase/reductase [Desulfatitalea tepidiphila]|uniref:short-chain dehydrogenase/reductase n=1 Tax=Desulfatitalea tepidiphila TaxID=1185843 RepID=UPI0006B66EF0|nr:short-chain dehydrogenase/reductase [Desulfatitalea tepidiphila]
MDLGLKGKSVLITGGSKGIGRATAETLSAEGCNLHLAARDETQLRETQKKIESKHRVSVTLHPVDLSIGDHARKLAAACKDIDILVNNAGAIPRGNLWQIDEAQWREAWDLKVFGYINLTRAVYDRMRARGKGVIVNVIGAAGQRPLPDYIAGGTGNAALMAFTTAMGGKSLRDGIRVVAINPGLIKTQRLEALLRSVAQAKFKDADRWQDLMPSDPPPGDPEDVARLVAFLASDCAKFITGTVVTIDGGYSAT